MELFFSCGELSGDRNAANLVEALRAREPSLTFAAVGARRLKEAGAEVLFDSSQWGSVGWFGTFAVLPDFQGIGIGKKLISASVDYLQQRSVDTIGLETMPMSSRNLGLYLKLGFQPTSPTLLLEKKLVQGSEKEETLQKWSNVDKDTQNRWISELRRAVHEIHPCLDYSKEILATEEFKAGETLVLTVNHQAVGFSTIWLAGIRVTGATERASVQILALHPAFTCEENLLRLINASITLARAHNKQILALSANTCHSWAVDQLLNWGFRVERMRIRMILTGTGEEFPSAKHVDLSHYAG